VKTASAWFLSALFAGHSTQAQGTFENLNFESATVSPSGLQFSPIYYSISAALPGWSAYLGNQQITQVGYNSPPNSTASVCVIGPTWNNTDVMETGVGIIDGNYSVDLQTGADPTGNEADTINASIQQEGTIPANAQSILFAALETTPLTVSFNGNVLSPIALSSGTSPDGLPYSVYGASISAWAGQTGDLNFTADFNGSYNYVVLDDISFSPTAVPEPNTLGLALLGGAAFGARLRHKRGS